jgi:hypothetical protein
MDKVTSVSNSNSNMANRNQKVEQSPTAQNRIRDKMGYSNYIVNHSLQ